MSKNAVIASFSSFNSRRYGAPWIGMVNESGKLDFSKEVGTYTGNGYKGEEGSLVVFEPVVGQVYGYGRKDYRGNNTMFQFAKWDGTDFIPCDKLGFVKEEG